ncbi:FG-GAP-like repeat-containing protein [Streptomyces sp. NPDC099088]|uniref:FG-GAP-like repeat-containing protein n=1 Tax=Streptomyces sp. NPDC099088 TaxID=3366101 RepID=UPI003830553B
MVAALLCTPLASAIPVPQSTTVPITDFNGDGYADLAIAAPQGTVAGAARAGFVSVVYGSSAGTDTSHPQNLSRATSWIPGEPTEDERFGSTTAARDLDGDGYTDLVVGGSDGRLILWGSSTGLNAAVSAGGTAAHVASGDVNGDGKGDLVLSSDNEVIVHFGPFSRSGIPSKTSSLPIDEEHTVWDIAVGDVTGDGKDDLLTTHGFEEDLYQSRFWKGTATGFTPAYKNTGYTTYGGVIADVDRDGYGDFVTRQVSDLEMMDYDAGELRIVYGSATGPSTRTAKLSQDTAGVPGASEAGLQNGNTDDYGDQFGYSLTAGDVTGDGYPDIAVGVPGEDIGTTRDAGAVVLLKGSKSGLTGTGSQALNQSTASVPGASEMGDTLGKAVVLADVNANNRADLALGAPSEDSTYQDSGAVWVFRGSKTGLTTTNIASFGPAALGAPDNGSLFGLGFAR